MKALTPKQRAALQAVADGTVTACDESKGDDTATYQLMYDAGLITLADASADDGTMFLNMRITLLGQTHLRLPHHSGATAEALRALIQRQETLAAMAESHRRPRWETADTVEVERNPAIDIMIRSIPTPPPTPSKVAFLSRPTFWTFVLMILALFFSQDEMKGFVASAFKPAPEVASAPLQLPPPVQPLVPPEPTTAKQTTPRPTPTKAKPQANHQ